MTTSTAVSALVVFFAALFVALALTAVGLMADRAECHTNGGTYSVDGGTAWCRY